MLSVFEDFDPNLVSIGYHNLLALTHKSDSHLTANRA